MCPRGRHPASWFRCLAVIEQPAALADTVRGPPSCPSLMSTGREEGAEREREREIETERKTEGERDYFSLPCIVYSLK